MMVKPTAADGSVAVSGCAFTHPIMRVNCMLPTDHPGDHEYFVEEVAKAGAVSGEPEANVEAEGVREDGALVRSAYVKTLALREALEEIRDDEHPSTNSLQLIARKALEQK